MIYFHFSSATPTLFITSSLMILFFLLSLVLNPTVFIYNKRKSSLAGLLFCVMSATDFLVCILLPGFVLYYAATIKLEDMECKGVGSAAKQPQNCFAAPNLVNIITSLIISSLNTTVFITTGVLAVVRSIQIIYPFYPIEKRNVVTGLLAVVIIQVSIHGLFVFVPLGEAQFSGSRYVTMTLNPFNLPLKSKAQKMVSVFLQNCVLTLVQVAAVVSCIMTAVFLYQQRLDPRGSRGGRVLSAVKVMMTNLMSFLLVTILGTPIWFYVNESDFTDNVPTEANGWLQFWGGIMLSIVSSIWNPVVFLSLTPKSRASLRSLFGGCKSCQKDQVEIQQEHVAN